MTQKRNTVPSNASLHPIAAFHPIDVDPLNKDKGFVVSQKNFEETKKLIETFRPHLTKQITYLSYEGSVVVLVRLALSKGGETACVVSGLPKIDRDTINEVVPEGFRKDSFFVSLNKYNDFEMKFIKPVDASEDGITLDELNEIIDELLDKEAETGIECDFSSKFKHNDKVKEVFTVEFINTVHNPRYEDIHSDEGNVEDNGVKVNVDGIPLNKKLVEKVVNGELPVLLPDGNGFYTPKPKSTPINEVKSVNKNAYEIRTDVLGMAIDWLRYQTDMAVNERGNETHIPLSAPSNAEVLATAKQFYSFVENRR